MNAAGDFTPGVAALLDRADGLCARRGARLTDLRRQVLGLILEARAPMGAYDLLESLRGHRRGAAPPTVYRALDFLMAQGLIHRVERLSAFVGCVAGDDHVHAAQFLICRSCGAVDEVDDHAVAAALGQAAAAKGFTPGHATVEVEGTCAGCAALPPG